jgi:hypothetical protein
VKESDYIIQMRVLAPYLVSIESFKIIAAKVSWVPISGMLGNKGPEETP